LSHIHSFVREIGEPTCLQSLHLFYHIDWFIHAVYIDLGNIKNLCSLRRFFEVAQRGWKFQELRRLACIGVGANDILVSLVNIDLNERCGTIYVSGPCVDIDYAISAYATKGDRCSAGDERASVIRTVVSLNRNRS
jgi:hypothetical protein